MLGGQFSNVTDDKTGVFQEWTEDHEVVDITLPLPAGTAKKDLVCKMTPDSLVVRRISTDTTLLRAEPLGGPIDVEESTWTLQGDQLCLQLAKQWRRSTKSDQYWGATLAAKGGIFECYMTPKAVRELKKEKARKEQELEAEHRERVRASEKALRERGPAPPKVEKRILNPHGAEPPNRPSQREAAKQMWKEKQEEELGKSGLAYFVEKFAQTLVNDKKFAMTLLVCGLAFVWSYLPSRAALFGTAVPENDM